MDKPVETVHPADGLLAAHRHQYAYAALVLDGSYEEASLDGLVRCEAGWLVIHPPYHQHADRFGSSGAVVMNVVLDAKVADSIGYGAAPLPNHLGIAHLAHRDGHAAVAEIIHAMRVAGRCKPPAWLAEYVIRLLRSTVSAADLARGLGVSPEHASRMCKRWYGTGPMALRREKRVRDALHLLRQGASPSQAAMGAGFCDQPHLTRVIRAITGKTPANLRGRHV